MGPIQDRMRNARRRRVVYIEPASTARVAFVMVMSVTVLMLVPVVLYDIFMGRLAPLAAAKLIGLAVFVWPIFFTMAALILNYIVNYLSLRGLGIEVLVDEKEGVS